MRILARITFGLVLIAAVACGSKEKAAESGGAAKPASGAGGGQVIKIVSSLPRTGSANAQTTTVVNGIRMAIEEFGGKAGDFKIEYEDWDDASPQRGQWDPSVEAANADKAIKDPDVMAYIGNYNSGATKISAPKLNAAGLVMVSPAVSYPGITKPGLGEANEPMVYRPSGKVRFFRVVPADDIQGSHAAEWAKQMDSKRAYVLNDGELYGKGVADVFRKHAVELGITITGDDRIDYKASNYKSLVTKIKEQNVDLVYYGGTTQTNAGQIAKDLVAGGLNVKFMVPDGCFEHAFIEAAGKENLEDRAFVTFGGLPPNQLTGKGKEFYDNYKKKYNAEPEGYAIYGYEAMKVVLEAIKRVGKKDRLAIIDAVAATKDYDGALGHWSFDENGDTTIKTVSGSTVKNGEFSFVKAFGQ